MTMHAEKILDGLDRIEKHFGVRILYACESGSRAWGFASPDSDYDVRFIYARRQSDYLTVFDDMRDVIDGIDLAGAPELPPGQWRSTTDDPTPETNGPLRDLTGGALDFSGWDVRKALLQGYKSNPSLHEWLSSPVVYYGAPEQSTSTAALKDIVTKLWTPTSSFYHYRSMGKRTYIEQIKGRTEATYKRYLYVIRALLCCRYVYERTAVPPVLFDEVLDSVGGDLPAQEMLHLLKLKKSGTEAEKQTVIPALNNWIEAELEKPVAVWAGRHHNIDRGEVDAVFRSLL